MPVKAKVLSHKVLTGGSAKIEAHEGKLDISVSKEDRHALDTIIKLVFEQPLE